MSSEKSPLLDRRNQGDSRESREASGPSQNVFVPPIGPHELPPPYDAGNSGSLMVACKVCSCMIDISGKKNQHVVKCSNCNEATPVKAAPLGKKYVRCPCNCLLICKAGSERVSCPREECRRIITLIPNPVPTSAPNVPGVCQVSCGHCHNTFLFNTLNNSLARCPHCQKVSSIGLYFARRRALIFLALAVLALSISAIVIGISYYYAATHGGIYVLFIGLPICGLILLAQSIRFFIMKVSIIEGPA